MTGPGAISEQAPVAGRRRNSHVLAAAVVALQLVTLAVAVGPWLLPRLGGDEYRLAVAPVDPIDPFRGAYVALRYAGVPTYLGQPIDARTVYMPLERRGDAVWQGTGTYVLNRPVTGPFLACAKRRGSVSCGIESLFASQDRAKDLEVTLAGSAVAKVRIDRAGRAAVIGLEAAREPGGR